LTLIEVIAVIACVAFLFILLGLVPGPSHAKAKSKLATCQSDLKQIGIAFRTWDADHDDKYPMSVSTTNGGSMEWAAGNNLFKHFQVMSNELDNPNVLLCPSDDRDVPRSDDFANLSNSNLSYFVGLDADETRPTMILAGDRNLLTNGVPVIPGLVIIGTNSAAGWSTKMHKRAGNILFADGSVARATNDILPSLFQKTGTNINRLAVP
jgi:prepilin-type processing-associated H-X9-DG protein